MVKVFNSPVETIPEQVAIGGVLLEKVTQKYPEMNQGLGVFLQTPDTTGTKSRFLVPKPGFEPGQAYTHQTLNLARLPIPPLRQCPHVRNFAPIYTDASDVVK